MHVRCLLAVALLLPACATSGNIQPSPELPARLALLSITPESPSVLWISGQKLELLASAAGMDPMKALEPYGMDSGALTAVVVAIDEEKLRTGQPGAALAAYAGKFGTGKLTAALEKEGFAGRTGDQGFTLYRQPSKRAGAIAVREGLVLIGDDESIGASIALMNGNGRSVVTPEAKRVIEAVGDCGLVSLGVNSPYSRALQSNLSSEAICVGLRIESGGQKAVFRIAALLKSEGKAKTATANLREAIDGRGGLEVRRHSTRGRIAFVEARGPFDRNMLGR